MENDSILREVHALETMAFQNCNQHSRFVGHLYIIGQMSDCTRGTADRSQLNRQSLVQTVSGVSFLSQLSPSSHCA